MRIALQQCRTTLILYTERVCKLIFLGMNFKMSAECELARERHHARLSRPSLLSDTYYTNGDLKLVSPEKPQVQPATRQVRGISAQTGAIAQTLLVRYQHQSREGRWQLHIRSRLS
jgi:hypothetical protein